MTKREFLDIVFALAPNEANAIMDAFDEYVESNEPPAPPAQPERKRGKWIHHPEWEEDGDCGYECSECHMGSDVDYNFCMRCGAYMREVTT